MAPRINLPPDGLPRLVALIQQPNGELQILERNHDTITHLPEEQFRQLVLEYQWWDSVIFHAVFHRDPPRVWRKEKDKIKGKESKERERKEKK